MIVSGVVTACKKSRFSDYPDLGEPTEKAVAIELLTKYGYWHVNAPLKFVRNVYVGGELEFHVTVGPHL